MKPTVTAGLAVLAGVALFEAALIPGVVIGGAAVLAPKFLPGLRRRLKPLFGSTVHRPPKPAAPSPGRRDVQVPAAVWRVRDQAGNRQDHHLPDHRHDARLHHELHRDR